MPTITPTIIKSVHLEYKGGRSDKVYNIWIEKVGGNTWVKFSHARSGATLIPEIKVGPTDEANAEKVFTALLKEKTNPSRDTPYSIVAGASLSASTGPVTIGPTGSTDVAAVMNRAQLLNPIIEKDVEIMFKRDGYVLQEKHDGVRMMLAKRKGAIAAINKRGLKISPPENYCSALQKHFADYDFIIDGEACGPVFWAFDILKLEDTDCEAMPYEERLVMLGMLLRSGSDHEVIRMVLTAEGARAKQALFEAIKKANGEGVVFKEKLAPYTAGRPNSGGPQLKYKFVESCTCRVVKVNDKRSVMLGVADISGFVTIGNVTIPANHEIPKSGDFVEIQYLYAYKGGSLYQPVYKGKRDDADIDNISTLKYKREVEDE